MKKKENKLKAYWNKKENDLYVDFPLGIMTKCDSNYLFGVFNDNFIEELKQRGYDITTLKFEITVDNKGERYKEKFPTLASLENKVKL